VFLKVKTDKIKGKCVKFRLVWYRLFYGCRGKANPSAAAPLRKSTARRGAAGGKKEYKGHSIQQATQSRLLSNNSAGPWHADKRCPTFRTDHVPQTNAAGEFGEPSSGRRALSGVFAGAFREAMSVRQTLPERSAGSCPADECCPGFRSAGVWQTRDRRRENNPPVEMLNTYLLEYLCCRE